MEESELFNVEDFRELTKLSEEESYLMFLEEFRENHVPKRYNQIHLLDELTNPEIDHYMSISNRTDGKSFNYIHALLVIAIEYEIGISFYSRNMMLRASYQELLKEIIEMSDILDLKHFSFIRNQYYIAVEYESRTIAIISDLNNATELKYFSSFLRNFPIMVYDEFIALETDYLPDEWERLKTIYQSVDRLDNVPLIHKPKIFYFGNAVNFESPILHGLKIFNILEKHPINTMRVYKYDFNVALEINRNENANSERNTRAFGTIDDAMTTAQFETNDFNIASEDHLYHVRRNPRTIYIKLDTDYLRVYFNRDDLLIVLSVESRIDTDDDYAYNMNLRDNKENSTYLSEKYFSERHVKRIVRGNYLFANYFSKNRITSIYPDLNINKIIKEYLKQEKPTDEIENKEKQFKENYIRETKRALFEKMWR